MLVIFKKIAYILLVLGANLYICSYINSKLVSRMELRSGYSMTKVKSLSYPMVKFLKCLSKDYKLNIWEVFILLFSFLIWSIVPFTSNLVLVDIDYSLFAGIVLYILLLVLNIIGGGKTSYNFLFSIIMPLGI